MITRYDYHYDGQMTRFLEQIVRAFSGFQYETGRRNGNEPERMIVPCRMAARDRMVANIRRNLSANTLNTVPVITIDMTSLEYDKDRLQNPNYVSHLRVDEREFDEDSQSYTGNRGKSYSVERLMPMPFTMTVQVDIWVSNQLQKFQLMEQILYSAFPGFDIQNSDNALDWTALTTATGDSINWSSISIPVGDNDQIDIATIGLKIPFWISPPARVMQQRVIEQIVANVSDGTLNDHNEINGSPLGQAIITPGDHYISIADGVITLLGANGSETDPSGHVYRWDSLLAQYGPPLRPTETQIRLRANIEDDSRDIIGTLQADTQHPNRLFWQIITDSLPANSLAAINAIINPHQNHPGDGVLPAAAQGQRYLLIEDIGVSSIWGFAQGFLARAGNIIQYQNGAWNIVFSGSDVDQYVLNLRTGKQLRWTNGEFVMAIDGVYGPGHWRIGGLR
jgi:hypothetical protein